MRENSPVNSTIISGIGSSIFLIVYLYTTWLSAYGLSAILIALGSVQVVALSGMLFPYTCKRMYESSPIAKYKIGKIPLISVLGTIGFFFNLYLIVILFTNPAYGANTPEGLAIIGGVYLVAIIIYFASKYYRKSKGIDTGTLFREIPPE